MHIKKKNTKENFSKSRFIEKNKERKLIEFSVRTKFSSLDGISSPSEYMKFSKIKNYRAYVINDHSTVQSFPDFSALSSKSDDLRIIYGCEFEMIEDKFPSYIFINSYKQEAIFNKSFDDIVYCSFDLETTGLLSSYDEIIEIGYVIWKGKEIILQESFLVKPNRPVSKEITKIVGISNEDLDNSLGIHEVLKKVSKTWKDNSIDLIIAHNAFGFDLLFLRRFWLETFSSDVPYPFLDTLPLSWIVFPDKKSYSLEKLHNYSKGKDKVKQEHRSLADSLLLKSLIEKIIKTGLEAKISSWRGFIKLLSKNKNIGKKSTKIIAVAKNQKGLFDLYKMIKISHVDNYSKSPFLYKKDVLKHRKNIFIGASGDNESEIFSSFSSFTSDSEKKKRLLFYDYVEVRNPECFSHLVSSRMLKENLEEVISNIINVSNSLNIKVVSSNNVHYCEKFQKKIKDIIISNPAINGFRHKFYNYATMKREEDRFEDVPFQHLRSIEEIAESWSFLNDQELIEEIVFDNQEKIVSEVEDISILNSDIGYPVYKNSESDIMNTCSKKIKEIFGNKIPDFALDRLNEEWRIIKKKYLSVYWLSWKVVSKAQELGNIVGSRGSVGCSFVAYLLNITDINPLPLYSICKKCKDFILIKDYQKSSSCFDFKQMQFCKICKKNSVYYDGHSLPFETFVGWEGEKIPDIDLNFSGEYQKKAHNYIREILGEENVYRIGTVNKLSSQTADNFWEEHIKLRKKINKDFNLRDWCEDFFEQIKNTKSIFSAKEFAIEQLKGIKRTTGQHPGGLLIIPPKKNIIEFTPLNYPADDTNSEWLTTHFEYSFLSQIFLKMDILGHDEPTVLEKLHYLTGINPLDEEKVRFDDERIMELFTKCDTLGIPEFGTDLVKKNLLDKIKPTKFSQLVQISGFSHGTNVWLQNQFYLYKEKKLPIEKLLACREDILNLLREKNVGKKESFIATEFIRKGKWEKLDVSIKNEIKSKTSDSEGNYYFSILEKIKYIFPKPHAIAYTMTAWRTAYYKAYFPKEFFSVLLTYHTNVYDIWLMTFDTKKAIPLRIIDLLDNFDNFKNVKKEFISVCKVLMRISKENKDVKDFLDVILNDSKSYYEILEVGKNFDENAVKDQYLKKIEELKIQINENIEKKNSKRLMLQKKVEKAKEAFLVISNKNLKILYDFRLSIREKILERFAIKDLMSEWRLTAREKNLFFTLKVISEIKAKGYNISIGLDFNFSDVSNFSFSSGKLLIPFLAINGIGDSVSKKVVQYRKDNKKIKDWKNDLKDILNKKNFLELEKLENNGMIFI